MIDYKDLELPETTLPINQTSEKEVTENHPPCLQCSEPLQLTDQAIETVAIRRMCEIQQSVVKCPACNTRMAIYPKGKVPVTSSDDCVCVGAPEEGWYIAFIG